MKNLFPKLKFVFLKILNFIYFQIFLLKFIFIILRRKNFKMQRVVQQNKMLHNLKLNFSKTLIFPILEN